MFLARYGLMYLVKHSKIVLCLLALGFLFAVSFVAKTTHASNSYSFTASPGSEPGTINIGWYDDGNETQFDIQYGPTPTQIWYGQTGMADTKNSNNSYTIRGLTPGSTYYIKLVAENGTSNPTIIGPISTSATSGSIQAKVSTIPSSTASQYNLSVSQGASPGTVKLSWTDNNSTNQYDIIYGATPNQLFWGAYSVPFSKGVNNSYVVSALVPGRTYYFELVATSGGNSSKVGPVSTQATSGTVQSTASPITSGPIGQYNLSVNSNSAGTAKVSWTDDGSADQYNIVYGPLPNQYFWGSYNVGFSSRSANNASINALNSGGSYYFALIAMKNGTTIYKSAPVKVGVR